MGTLAKCFLDIFLLAGMVVNIPELLGLSTISSAALNFDVEKHEIYSKQDNHRIMGKNHCGLTVASVVILKKKRKAF